MLSRAIQSVYGLPHFPGQWRIAGALRSLLPGGVGLFADGDLRYFVHASSHVGHALATGVDDKDLLAELRREPGSTAPPPAPPPRARSTQSYQYASSPPPRARQSNPLLDALDRLFGR